MPWNDYILGILVKYASVSTLASSAQVYDDAYHWNTGEQQVIWVNTLFMA